jgi:hypothetical protein
VSTNLPHYPQADDAADGCGMIMLLMLATLLLLACAGTVWWLA